MGCSGFDFWFLLMVRPERWWDGGAAAATTTLEAIRAEWMTDERRLDLRYQPNLSGSGVLSEAEHSAWWVSLVLLPRELPTAIPHYQCLATGAARRASVALARWSPPRSPR